MGKKKIILWLILFICAYVLPVVNPAILFAQSPADESSIPISPEESPPPATGDGTTPTINLSFTLPGIGKEGTVTPLHTTRPVVIQLYKPTDNPAMQPFATISETLTFDKDSFSFDNSQIVLTDVPPGEYKVFVKTPHYLRQQLQNPDNTPVSTLSAEQITTFSPTKLIAGDIVPLPNGDNIIDVRDYQGLINCYGTKAATKTCADKDAADLNDDGLVDGIDYNIFLLGLRTYLIQNNLLPSVTPTPRVSVTATPSATNQPILSPTPLFSPTSIITQPPPSQTSPVQRPVTTTTRSSSLVPLIVFIVILLAFVGAGIFIVRKLRHKKETPEKETPEEPKKEPETKETKPAATADASAPVTTTATPAPATDQTRRQAEAATIDFTETGFVKIVRPDEEKGGVWVSIAGKEEVLQGHYHDATIQDGFAEIKGTRATAPDGQAYIEIVEIKPEA